MQDDIYRQEPNLIAEAYRTHTTPMLPRRIERHFDFIDINDGNLPQVQVLQNSNLKVLKQFSDGLLLLGTSNLGGRIWSGSIWVFEDYPIVPDSEKCVAGIEFESSVGAGLWLNHKNIVIACDCGSVHHLLLEEYEDKKKHYFTTESIAAEHDDVILALDLMSKKTKILSGGMDMNIKVWDVETFLPDKSYCPAHGHIVTSLSSRIDGTEVFASTSLDGTCLIWDTREKKPASLLMRNECGFTSCAWVDEQCISIGSSDGSVSLVDLRMKSEYDRYATSKRPIFKISYNKELQLLAVCADDPFVRVFSCREKTLTNVYESDQHKDFVRGLAWEPSSKTLYSCGWDSKIFSHAIVEPETVKENEQEKSPNDQ